MNPSSHPYARLTHTRMYTRRVTTMEAMIVNVSATTRKDVPLFCLPPGGSCKVALMMGARMFLRCVEGLGPQVSDYRRGRIRKPSTQMLRLKLMMRVMEY